ncbi:hypothetical protein OH768_30375 [Streptomyces sp. NBC_01622]|uniref:hypothetical protein n=1 Tax=Streptomyces sp. NBC_01622 TaxID=2975903 RepID=UPI00386C4049|nr:hypothetical protein OH768_30375 [Streptomyces sp. NBC_01622]
MIPSDVPKLPGLGRTWYKRGAVASCGLVVWGWLQQRRAIRKKLLNPPTPAAWSVGRLAAAFAVREYPSEVGARRAMEASADLHRLAGGKERLR